MTFSDPATGLLPEPDKLKRATGAPRGNRNALKHGIYSNERFTVDMRTRLDRTVVTTVAAIEAELGGSDALTAQKRVILEGFRWKLKRFLQADTYLDERRSPINKRKGAFIPIVDQQKQLLESIRRDLVDLGLERFKKPPEPLEDYLKRRRDGGGGDGDGG